MCGLHVSQVTICEFVYSFPVTDIGEGNWGWITFKVIHSDCVQLSKSKNVLHLPPFQSCALNEVVH